MSQKQKLEKLLVELIGAIKIGLFYLPDSSYYDKKDERNYPWEACDDEQQEGVKQARHIMNKALEKCKKSDWRIE